METTIIISKGRHKCRLCERKVPKDEYILSVSKSGWNGLAHNFCMLCISEISHRFSSSEKPAKLRRMRSQLAVLKAELRGQNIDV